MIEIDGIEEIVRRLGVAQTIRLLRSPIWRGVARIVGFMGDYPAQPAETTYRRTGTLGRRWTEEVTETADGIEGEVGNASNYGPFVQSQQFQARWMGHWQTDEDAVDTFQDPIAADIEETLQGALNGTVS